jgi:hypothetical protein
MDGDDVIDNRVKRGLLAAVAVVVITINIIIIERDLVGLVWVQSRVTRE